MSVSMRAEADYICICVSDTGIGMSEEVKAHIFDKYYQGDSSRTGKGLGLSIVYRIIELCGGKIQVESTPEQGSNFTVRLPVWSKS